MKTIYILPILGLLLFSCKNESNTQKIEDAPTTETVKTLTEAEKTEIVKYYLINERQLAEKDFYKIIFLNDAVDGVKVIHYEGRDAFFGFKFSNALAFYNANKK